jgi:outer membrane protein assembly factor BamB
MSLIFTQKSQTPMLALNIASANVVQILSIDSGQTLYKFDLQATKSKKKLKNLGVVSWVSDFVQDTYLNTYFGCDSALCLIRNNMTIVRSRIFPNRTFTSAPVIHHGQDQNLLITVADDASQTDRYPILVAFDLSDLSVSWEFNQNITCIGTLSIFNENVYFTAQDTIWIVDVKNTTFLNVKLNTTLNSRMAIGYNQVMVTSTNGYLYALNTSSNTITWKRPLLSVNITQAMTVGNPIVTADGNSKSHQTTTNNSFGSNYGSRCQYSHCTIF